MLRNDAHLVNRQIFPLCVLLRHVLDLVCRTAVYDTFTDCLVKHGDQLSLRNLAREVVDLHNSLTGLSDSKLKSSLVDGGVGVEADLVGTSVGNGGNAVEDIGVENLIDVVNHIGGIHEDTTAISAEVHGIGPLGLGEVVLDLGDTVVTNIRNHRIVAGDLIHRGDRNAVEGTVCLPRRIVDAGSAFLHKLCAVESCGNDEHGHDDG